MPRLASFYGIDILLFFDDHNPPHFHAWYSGDEALIVISDGSVYSGHLPRRALALVRQWRAQHVTELEAAWALASNRGNPGTIEPLR